MGVAHKDALWLDFGRKLKLDSHIARITSDAGLFVYRELDGIGVSRGCSGRFMGRIDDQKH